MAVEIDLSEFNWFPALMARRQNFVQDVVDEGTARANSYAAAGGRRRPAQSRRYLRRSRIMRPRQATANQRAHMIEYVCYRKFIDWWANW
jgi:hypothetical protein